MTYSLLLGLCYFFQWCKSPDIITDGSFLSSFSSKTSYRHSNLQNLRHLYSQESECKLVHVNALFRHGTRFPAANDITKIAQVHRKIIESRYSSNLPRSFLDWKPTFSLHRAKNLSSVGYEEMMHLGRRFRNRLNKVDGYFNATNHMEVFTTSVSRARHSGEAFLYQFLRGKRSAKKISDMVKESDAELRFFDNCPIYTKSVLKNKAYKIEYKRFSNGPEIKKTIEDIRRKWNLKDIELESDDVRNLYVMCGYEIANNKSISMSSHMCSVNGDRSGLDCPSPAISVVRETSPLCSLLEPGHYTIFEYLYDLKHYWTKAYGSKINWLQSCDLMSPILDQIVRAAEGHGRAYKAATISNEPLYEHAKKENYLRAAFWFGHAETLLPLAALLNLFNQSTPMTADQYPQRRALLNDRKERFSTFRVSNIAPFSGNLALELYHCPHLGDGVEGDDYFIRVKSNEKAVRLSMANGDTQISLKAFRDHLKICSPMRYKHNDVCGL